MPSWTHFILLRVTKVNQVRLFFIRLANKPQDILTSGSNKVYDKWKLIFHLDCFRKLSPSKCNRNSWFPATQSEASARWWTGRCSVCADPQNPIAVSWETQLEYFNPVCPSGGKSVFLHIFKLKIKKKTIWHWAIFPFVQRKLRNRFIEDRKLARDILSEMCTLLGPKYFSFLLSVLEGTLQRGYQVHILVSSLSNGNE